MTRNRSVACGAWQHLNGNGGHEFCHGTVALPPPLDVCSCWCHGREDGDSFDGTEDEYALYTEATQQYALESRTGGTTLTFADWLIEDTEA